MPFIERYKPFRIAIIGGLIVGAAIAYGVGYAVEAYRSASVTYHVAVNVKVITQAGKRLLSIHFATGAVRFECANTTQWYLTGTRDGVLIKLPLMVTVNGVRQQNDPDFDFWVEVPSYVPAGMWHLYYRTASTCPWLIWYATTVWNSERGEVDLP